VLIERLRTSASPFLLAKTTLKEIPSGSKYFYLREQNCAAFPSSSYVVLYPFYFLLHAHSTCYDYDSVIILRNSFLIFLTVERKAVFVRF